LEFLSARFALDELWTGVLGERAFFRMDPLTWETRRMMIPNLTADHHGKVLQDVIEDSRHRHFKDVEYQASNALTLLLDKQQDNDILPSNRGKWRSLLLR